MHENEAFVEVDLRQVDARQLGEAHSGVEEQEQDGLVADAGEAVGAEGGESFAHLLGREWLDGRGRGFDLW